MEANMIEKEKRPLYQHVNLPWMGIWTDMYLKA